MAEAEAPRPLQLPVRFPDLPAYLIAVRLLLAYPERQAEIESLRSYQVWRQGTDGNPFKVGERTSKRDADCWVRHFDSLGHHQHYWFSKVDPE